MNFALNLAGDGRILSATYPKYSPADAVIVESLPDGDIYEYIYSNGEYIHDPIPIDGNEQETLATEEDYQQALREMSVNV
jgi:hypothetical protein